jgi:hypothetical protein
MTADAPIALEETTRSSVRLIVSEELPEIINRFTNTGKTDNSAQEISEQPEDNAEPDNSENINSDIAENSPPIDGQEGNQNASKDAVKTNSSNTTIRSQDRGKAYNLSRLQDQHPEIFERVKSGELSANAAAIQAGFS